MNLISTRVLALATAALALASCSSEPSDWRPDEKVSLDMIAPGTRPTGNIDQLGAPVSDENGGAIAHPLNSDTNFDHPRTTAEGATSANSKNNESAHQLPASAKEAPQPAQTATEVQPGETNQGEPAQ